MLSLVKWAESYIAEKIAEISRKTEIPLKFSLSEFG